MYFTRLLTVAESDTNRFYCVVLVRVATGQGQKLPSSGDHCHPGVCIHQLTLFSALRKCCFVGWNPKLLLR